MFTMQFRLNIAKISVKNVNMGCKNATWGEKNHLKYVKYRINPHFCSFLHDFLKKTHNGVEKYRYGLKKHNI